MEEIQLINKNFHILQRNKISRDPEKFIYKEIGKRINDNLEGINLNVKECLEIGLTSLKIYEYLKAKFKEINYTAIDISNKLLTDNSTSIEKYCIDHDEWAINNNKFDLIISNFYLHLSDNLEILLKNINDSLKDNSFFLASIPGLNCLHELKESMFLADISIYNGAYKRFQENYSILQISKFLKKNNFKNPLIEIDTINFQYNNFEKLLKDTRYLGNSYIYQDRKKTFENKKYFKKVEEIYWKKFSNNNKINLTFEIIFFSGWK